MIGAVRAEVVRAVSAPQTTITLCALALFIPAVVLQYDGTLDEIAALGSGAATERMLQPLGWSFVAASFVGMYAVTREYYYDSMSRTLVVSGFARAFWGKAVGAAVVGVVLAGAVAIVWSVVVAVLLGADGLVFSWTPGAARAVAGSLPGAAIGALLGAGVGWLVRNYYLGAGIVLGLPMLVEFALLRTAPDVARFSPGAALAALAVSDRRDGVLSLPAAAGVIALWVAIVLGAGWVLGRRRSA